jgi:NAD-dependent SIR2 family protein deacetylase
VANCVPTARQAGARVVIVNGEETAMDGHADVVLRGSISAILPTILSPSGNT